MSKVRLTQNYLLVVAATLMIVAVAVNYSLNVAFNDPTTNQSVETIATQKPEPTVEFETKKSTFTSPLNQIDKRVAKKKFGTYVTPQNSPVSPEKFTGYHTGWDFEILVGEKDKDVAVVAFCDGKIVYKNSVSGYGGVLIQRCTIDKQVITVLYGHLRLSSIVKKIGDSLDHGSKIGLLGTGFTAETDGERKHLHFSLHRGTEINLKGYVSNKLQLIDWIDPAKYLD
ncbi:MAG: M23 family metallopeptidase [Patescibacteria group bacterium]